jgi:hypothetical protein
MAKTMKKFILGFCMISLIGLMAGLGTANAQPDQTVNVGSTYNYSTAVSITGSTFTWNVTGGTKGTDFNYTASTTNTQSIQWLQAGNYTIQVTEVSPHGCTNPSAPQNYTVQVVAVPTIEFATTSSANCSGASGTDLTLNLNFTGTVVYPVVVNYTIDGNPYSRMINSGTTISLGSEENILVNNTASDVTRVIVITSATSHGANLNVGTNSTHNYTVYATPQLNPITHN